MLSVQGPLIGMAEGIAQFCCQVQKRVPIFRLAYLKDTILNHIALNETCFNGSHGISIILDLIICASNAGYILLNL